MKNKESALKVIIPVVFWGAVLAFFIYGPEGSTSEEVADVDAYCHYSASTPAEVDECLADAPSPEVIATLTTAAADFAMDPSALDCTHAGPMCEDYVEIKDIRLHEEAEGQAPPR